jgi:hypothetical protein
MSAVSSTPDAAIALGIASTAIRFARTPEAQAERWLRVLRLHGEAGLALQALGVGEGRLRTPAGSGTFGQAAATRGDDRDVVGEVIAHARRIAAARDAGNLATKDVLLAVMQVYGAYFDRVLNAYGTDRRELTERLDKVAPPNPSSCAASRSAVARHR